MELFDSIKTIPHISTANKESIINNSGYGAEKVFYSQYSLRKRYLRSIKRKTVGSLI